MQELRERFGYGELRPGRMYVMHVQEKNERCEFNDEDSLCMVIRGHLAVDPEVQLTVVQLARGDS